MELLSARWHDRVILLYASEWDDRAEFLRAEAHAGRLTAPCCGAPLVLKWGVRKARHFAHPHRVKCPYDRWSEPESAEHLTGKVLLYEWCRDRFGDQLRFLALEHPLPETLQRPDVFAELVDGTRLALEYQRSAISPGDWQERHDGYQRLGIRDVWILGENRLAAALPSPEQQERWARGEPHMWFLNPRAFENLAAVASPYEVAWWRGEQQELLWAPIELDARTGREVHPWFERSALQRLRSLTYLDAGRAELVVYRAMRELPRHVDTRMASVCQRVGLAEPDVALTPDGFETAADRERLRRHTERVAKLLSAVTKGRAEVVTEAPSPYRVIPAGPLPPQWPAFLQDRARRRERRLEQAPFDPLPFLPGEQEREQQTLLQQRAEVPEWRRLVKRFGLNPENLFFLVGVPIPDDTVFQVHRTVWQAFLTYYVLGGPSRGFSVTWANRFLNRRFGMDQDMARLMTLQGAHGLSSPTEVTGTFLNLLVDCGYLSNEQRSEHFHYYPVQSMPGPLVFEDRAERWRAWSGLLQGTLRLEGQALAGDGAPILLKPAGR